MSEQDLEKKEGSVKDPDANDDQTSKKMTEKEEDKLIDDAMELAEGEKENVEEEQKADEEEQEKPEEGAVEDKPENDEGDSETSECNFIHLLLDILHEYHFLKILKCFVNIYVSL